MIPAKEAVRQVLESLPDEASFEEIQYSIYVREKIERGLAAADAKEFATDAEVEAEFNRWLPK